jgi:hypothetical protein
MTNNIELEPLNWLDQALEDFTLFKLQTLTYSYDWQWSRFIRS